MGKEEREARKKARREAAERRKEALAEARSQRAIAQTAKKSRALGFIQVAWVVEAMVVVIAVLVYIPILNQWRLELMGRLLLPVIGSILAEAGVAFGGPHIKKWLQGKYGKDTPQS